MRDSLLQSFILATEGSHTFPLGMLLRPVTLLRKSLLQHNDVTQQLHFLRVQIGRSAGLKATRRGLPCGHTSGIGSSTAGELLCGPSSKCV